MSSRKVLPNIQFPLVGKRVNLALLPQHGHHPEDPMRSIITRLLIDSARMDGVLSAGLVLPYEQQVKLLTCDVDTDLPINLLRAVAFPKVFSPSVLDELLPGLSSKIAMSNAISGHMTDQYFLVLDLLRTPVQTFPAGTTIDDALGHDLDN